MQAKTCKFLWF